MSLNHCTTSKAGYRHLSAYERGQIEVLLKTKHTNVDIARLLGRHPTTIDREIKRHTIDQLTSQLLTVRRYFADTAQLKYRQKRNNCGNKYKLVAAKPFIVLVEKLVLEKKWSPDAAIGHLKLTIHANTPVANTVTTRTLYEYISKGMSKIKALDLHLKVRRKNKRHLPVIRDDTRSNSIETRPDSINDRSEFGHWEIDTVIGTRTKSSVLLTIVERQTRQSIIIKLADQTAASVVDGFNHLEKKYQRVFPLLFKSITSDNGKEFISTQAMEYAAFSTQKRTHIYYAHPYSAYERGSNENSNAIIRRFIPKGKSIDLISTETVTRVQDWINSLPRRILGYKSSNDVFQEELNNLNLMMI